MSDYPPVPPRPPVPAPPAYSGPPPVPGGAPALPEPSSPDPRSGASPHAGAWQQPGAFTAPYAPAARGYLPAPHEPSSSRTLGVVAMIAGVAALVIPAAIAGAAGYAIGLGATQEVAAGGFGSDGSLAFLTPVRSSVLMAELAFWGGTIVGIWAVVQGIVAVAKRRGRGQGITAIVAGALGVFTYFAALTGALSAGISAAAGPGGVVAAALGG